jgi:ribosomal-protein-alanine N-acetyltransferase
MKNLPVLYTDRLQLNILSDRHAAKVLNYYRGNRSFHQPWFSARPDSIFTIEQQSRNLRIEYDDFNRGRALPFWLSLRSEPETIIGRFALTNIIQGSFRSAIASWHLDHRHTGRGYALEAGQEAMQAAWRDYKLHRIEANILPHNSNSIKLAQNLGFGLAGIENRYLEINGVWEDHLHFVALSDGPYHSDAAIPEITGNQVLIRSLCPKDTETLVDYFTRNQNHLGAYNPALPEELMTIKYWQKQLMHRQLESAHGRAVNLGIFLKDRPNKLIGCIDLRDVLKAPYNCCELGYSLDQNLTGQGLMLEALSITLGWIFSHLNINRVHARYLPENTRSERVLSMLGFKREGLQRQGLVTANGPRDLVLSGLLADEFCWIEQP